MKQLLTILGYIASLFLVSAFVFKVNRYPGEEIIMLVAGVLLSIYFPVYILQKGKQMNNGKTLAVNYTLAATLFFVILGITLKLSHLNLGSLAVLIGIGGFCLVYSPLLFIKKSKEASSNTFMIATGILGMMMFPLGIFLRVYMGSPFGMQLFTVGLGLIFLFFLPLFLFDKSLNKEVRQQRAETTLYTLIIGALLFFCLFRGVYPPKNEHQNQSTNQQAGDANQ